MKKVVYSFKLTILEDGGGREGRLRLGNADGRRISKYGGEERRDGKGGMGRKRGFWARKGGGKQAGGGGAE